MTRRACVLVEFDAANPGEVEYLASSLRRRIDFVRNVEVTVLDDGAPTLPAATAPGPAQQPIPKGPSQ